MIRKLIEKDWSYYRFCFEKSIIYFSHRVDVKDEDYINYTMKDLIDKIDELVGVVNSLMEEKQAIKPEEQNDIKD